MNLSAGPVSTDVGASVVCSTRTIWILRVLCVAGLSISAYLAWTALNMVQVFGCDGGSVIDCAHVLKSRWSKVLGVPVSLPACGLYASMLVMLSFVRRQAPKEFTQLIWSGLTLGATTAGLSAIWFVGLQLSDGKLCPYCIAVHTCSVLIAALILKNHVTSASMKGKLSTASVGAVAVLITLQVLTPEPETFQVVQYPSAATSPASSDTDPNAVAEEFAPPGDLFEAPGEIFEAPGAESDGSQANAPQTPNTEEAVKADNGQPVAAALLLVVPRKFWMLSNVPAPFFQDAKTHDVAATSQASDKSAESAATAKTEAAQPATVQKSDAVTSPDVEKAENEKPKAEKPKAPEVAVPARPERKIITVAGNLVSLDVKQWPLLGNPEARYVFVEMYDYTCPHCRNTHHAIKGAFEKYGDDLAIVALPVPLDPSCNDTASGGGHAGACELAKIAIAVWRVNPKKFREFHDWMFESHRSSAAARAEAERLVGSEKFRKEFSSKIPSDYVKRHVDLYKKVGRGSVPKLPRSSNC